jgi:DhnA family fructose-bisphosphate aldolase class Ia
MIAARRPMATIADAIGFIVSPFGKSLRRSHPNLIPGARGATVGRNIFHPAAREAGTSRRCFD